MPLCELIVGWKIFFMMMRSPMTLQNRGIFIWQKLSILKQRHRVIGRKFAF